MTDEQFISFEEAESQLGVTRATLHYYMRILKVDRHKFPLDKKAYMKFADFERIKRAKDDASRRSGQISDSDAA